MSTKKRLVLWKLDIEAAVLASELSGVRFDPLTLWQYVDELLSEPGFDPDNFCHRCKKFDQTPRSRRKSWMLRRPLYPYSKEACHGCVISMLEPVDGGTVDEELLLDEFHETRRRIRGLQSTRAMLIERQRNGEVIRHDPDEYAHLIDVAYSHLRKIAERCRAAGIEPFKPRTLVATNE